MPLLAAALLACAASVHADEIAPAQAQKWLAPGREAAQRGEYARARKLTEASLVKASQQLADDHWARAYLLNDLARWKSADGVPALALGDAEAALQIARRVFAGEAARVAYFALDVGVLRSQLGQCAQADAILSEALASFGASASTAPGAAASLREQVATSSARVAWLMGDLERARSIASAIPAPLLVAQIDVDAGRLSAARTQLDRYRAERGFGSDEAAWPAEYTQAELAFALGAGNLQPALARAQRLVDLPRADADVTAAATARHRLGQVLALLGRFAEAEHELTAAVQVLERRAGDSASAAASIHHDLAWTYRSVSDYPRSEFHFERALAGSSNCSGPSDSMPVLMLRERALLRIEQGKLTQALSDIDEATRKVGSVRGDTRVLRGLLVAARAFALDRLGEAAGAEKAMQEAVRLIAQAEGSASLNLPLGQVELADLALRRKGLAEARRQSTAALAILDARGTQSVWGTGAALSIRGAAANAAPEFWADAERFIGVTERGLAPAGAPTSANQSEIVLARRQAERLLDALPRKDAGHLALVARLMQLPHVSDATASLQISALDSQNLPREVRALVRKRSELLERSQALRSSLLLAQQRGQAIETEAVAALGEVTQQLAATDEALLRASPDVAGQLLQRSIDPAEVQRHLADGESLLLQVLTENAAHALLIDRRSVTHRTLAVSRKQLRTQVRQLRRALDLSLPAAERVPFNATSAHALYLASVGLFAKELSGRERLVVVADDALQSLPWSVLVDQLDGAGAARSFLVNRMSIATVPSLQSFVALRAAPPRAAARRPYVAFADPKMERFRSADPNSLRGREEQAALDLLGELPALPESAAEVQRMAQVLGAGARELYVGDKATEKAVRDLDLSQYRIISFATHGLMAGEIPGLAEPALVLTRQARAAGTGDDGLLTASEIAHLSLRAELVILSACNTGRINARAGVTGISGLARGFFAAGARSLVVSHWAVASESTALLLAKAVERMAADSRLGAASALRQAMLWMKDSGAGPVFARPEFWGAFSVVGASV